MGPGEMGKEQGCTGSPVLQQQECHVCDDIFLSHSGNVNMCWRDCPTPLLCDLAHIYLYWCLE